MKIIILSVLVITMLLGSCQPKQKKDEIETIAVATLPKQQVDIIIFFEQDTVLGNHRSINGRYFFYADDNPSIFFVKEQIGDGYLENYIINGDKLQKVHYESEMSIKNAVDSSYQVIGGTYSGINTPYYRKSKSVLRYITFRGGLAAKIKNNFMMSDSAVIAMYKVGLGIK